MSDRPASPERPVKELRLALTSEDYEGSLRFYRDVLGLPVLSSWERESGSGNRTFMRGIQRTDANGIATFRTVYPGWYQGRTVHIHVKVHVRGNVVHTGQLFFADALTDRVYRNAPYNKRPRRTTRNTSDSIFVNGGRKSLLAVRRRSAGGYLGRITMGVYRS